MNNVVRVFHVFCAPPCYLYEKQSLNLLSTPAMSLRSWPRPETGQSQLKQLGESEALKLEETNPLLEASWQLFFLAPSWILPVQRARIRITRYILLKNPKYQHHVSTSSVHRRFHHRLHALACIHAKRFSVPSDWRRLCSAQAVDFGAFLVHGREHGI